MERALWRLIGRSLLLTGDMDCSASATNAINVGKAGITINLNGHTLTGPTLNYTGIDNEYGYDRVTVENGMIVKFYFGVLRGLLTAAATVVTPFASVAMAMGLARPEYRLDRQAPVSSPLSLTEEYDRPCSDCPRSVRCARRGNGKKGV